MKNYKAPRHAASFLRISSKNAVKYAACIIKSIDKSAPRIYDIKADALLWVFYAHLQQRFILCDRVSGRAGWARAAHLHIHFMSIRPIPFRTVRRLLYGAGWEGPAVAGS